MRRKTLLFCLSGALTLTRLVPLATLSRQAGEGLFAMGAHLRVKSAVWLALRNAIRAAGAPCQALPDGASIETGESDYEPDAVVNCGPAMADDAIAAPNPVIVVEVLSPGTAAADTGGKLVGYFQVPSVVHYLIIHATKRVVTHHRRTSDGIDMRIIVAGAVEMTPPGLTISLDEIYDAG